MVTSGIQAATLFYEALHSQVDVLRQEVLVDVDKQLQKSGRFVALRGNSGGGKSYFLRRQLVPYYQKLAEGPADAVEGAWRVVAFSPQVNPIGTLAGALAAPGALMPEGQTQPFYREKIEQELRAGNDGLVKVVQAAREASGEHFRLLIVVDQLEDMFKMGDELHKDRSERYAGLGEFFQAGDDTLFFNLFLKALNTEIPVYVLFSIGSESLDRINAFQGWPERVSLHRYALPQVSTEEMKEALYGFWPEHEERPMPAGAQNLYQELLRDYKTFAAENKEPAARVNIALKLLYQRGMEWLDRPFSKLLTPPQFIVRALADGETAEARASLIKTRFLVPENQAVWLKWQAECPPQENQIWEQEVKLFYDRLRSYYTEFGGLGGAPDYLFNRQFERLSEDQQVLTRRLFQTITLKDATPERVAESYSSPFGILSEVCYRSGEEYPELLHRLELGTGFNEATSKEQEAAGQDVLRSIIHHFNFAGEAIPDLVRWVNPAGELASGEQVFLHDKMIIKLGTSMLVQEWSILREWVDEEYAAANIYKKLVQDATLHYREEAEKPAPEVEPKHKFPRLPKPSLIKDLWSSLTGTMSLLWQRQIKLKEDRKNRNRSLLSEGGVELVGEWFLGNLPSATWAEKYRPETLIADEEEAGTKFGAWVKAGAWTAFPLTIAFWEKSEAYHRRMRQSELARLAQQITAQQRVSRAMGVLFVLALLGLAYAGYQQHQAATANNTLKLLDFVDSMSKANVISSNVYRSENFANLKEWIKANPDIGEKIDVINFLDTSGVFAFPDATQSPRYSEYSKKALLQLDRLIDNYHDRTANTLPAMTAAVLTTADSAIALNALRTETAFQFPYVYQALWENLASLREETGKNKYGSEERGVVYKAPFKISAVASNPAVEDQYAIADDAGQVRILLKGDSVFTRVASLKESISSIQYSANGQELYASTYAGNIFRYAPLKSGATDKTPFGLTNQLDNEQLEVEWKDGAVGRGKGLAILAVHQTALPNYLLVIGDTDVTLICRDCDPSRNWRPSVKAGTYVEAFNESLEETQTALKVAGSNQAGTLFMIGGSGSSLLFRFDAELGALSLVREVVHKNISVSSIAFQPPLASSGLAQQNNPEQQQKIAVGTTTGDIWLTDLSAFSAQGKQQNDLMEKINSKTTNTKVHNYQESAITGLEFNGDQLISSSLDGTVWLFNLAEVDFVYPDFLTTGPLSGTWDHNRLLSTGRSVDNICLVNPNKLVAIENNTLRNWPTNIEALSDKVKDLLAEYQQKQQ